jgi:uncharacterized protein YciI
MNQYVIVAKDGKDENALVRRMQYRPAHFELMKRYKAEGKFISGGATLDKDGKMNGSVVVLQFASTEDVNTWINEEPYIQGKVWEEYEVLPFKVASLD